MSQLLRKSARIIWLISQQEISWKFWFTGSTYNHLRLTQSLLYFCSVICGARILLLRSSATSQTARHLIWQEVERSKQALDVRTTMADFFLHRAVLSPSLVYFAHIAWFSYTSSANTFALTFPRNLAALEAIRLFMMSLINRGFRGHSRFLALLKY